MSMREALTDLFRSMKFDVEAFDSAAAFLEKANLDRHGCCCWTCGFRARAS